MIIKVQNIQAKSKIQFRGKLPPETKQAIKTFTADYLKKQDGYVSSRGSVFNGIAIAMRGLSGTTLTAWLVEEIPKLIHNDITSTTAQVTTGIGSLAVALSRLENDRTATGKAMVQVKAYVSKLKASGFPEHDELIYGIKRFMNKKGGFYTSIIPNAISSKKAEKILRDENK